MFVSTRRRNTHAGRVREGRIFSRWLIGVGWIWMAGGIVLGPFAPAILIVGVVAILLGLGIYPNRRRLVVSLLALALGCWWLIAFSLFGQEWLARHFTS